MQDASVQHIDIWQDPESKIAFLESVLHGKNWRADIHVASADAKRLAQLPNIRHKLEEKGFKTKTIKDDDGHAILRLLHVDNPQDVKSVFERHGMVTGTAHTIAQPVVAMKDVIKDTVSSASHAAEYLKDPARANGFMFLLAELFITLGNTTAKFGSPWHPKNLLMSASGAAFASQSLAYLFVAKKGDERIAAEAKKQFAEMKDNGNILPDLTQAEIIGSKPATSVTGKAYSWVRDHPIQYGAWANNIGMLGLIGYALMEMRFRKNIIKTPVGGMFQGHLVDEAMKVEAGKYLPRGPILSKEWRGAGAVGTIGGALTSLLAWTLMLMPQKEQSQAGEGVGGAIRRIIDKHPEKVSSVLALASSSQRLLGGLSSSNPIYTLGEAVYIPGDLMLWFTKNTEYGNSRRGGHDKLFNVMGAFINELPVVMSPQRKQSFIKDTSDYLAKQSAALSAKKGEAIDATKIAEEAKHFEAELNQRVNGTHQKQFDLLMGAANRIVEKFAPEHREQVANALADALPQLNGVEASASDILPALYIAKQEAAADIECPHSMYQLADDLKALVEVIPNKSAGDNMAKLYDALAPLVIKTKSQTPDNRVSQAQIAKVLTNEAPVPSASV